MNNDEENNCLEQSGITFINQWPPDDDNNSIATSISDTYKRKELESSDEEQTDHDLCNKTNKRPHINISYNSTLESDDDNQQYFLWALPSIARWWRTQVAKDNIIYKGVTDSVAVANTKLKRILRRSDCKLFIDETINHLQMMKQKYKYNAQYYSALASFYDIIGDYVEALRLIDRSLQIDQNASDVLWLREKINRCLSATTYREKLLGETSSFQKLLNSQLDNSLPIERRSAEGLSYKEFLFQYALQAKPVIITGVVCNMTSVPWTFDHIQNIAGDKKATVKRLIPDSVEWARLESAHTMTVKEFLNSIDTTDSTDDSQLLLYLFDWSLPIHCPELANELTIPKYFAGDFLQRTQKGTLYHDSWPSLFIAPTGARSELHVDAFGSNFWMALFHGKKRWRIFRREDLPLLYPSYFDTLDATFDIDQSNNSQRALNLCQSRECILQPGELLFVPSGCPHRVENLEKSIAISANFVDLSNYDRVIRELEYSSMMDNESKVLLSQLKDANFFTSMNSQQVDLAWTDFKNWPTVKDSYSFDLTADNIKNNNFDPKTS